MSAFVLTWLVAMLGVYIYLGTTLKGHPRAFEATGALIQLGLQFFILPSFFQFPLHTFHLMSSPPVPQDKTQEQLHNQQFWLWIAYHVATVFIFLVHYKAGVPKVLDRFVDVMNRYGQLDHWWMWAVPSPAPILGWLSWLSMTGAVDVARDPVLPSAIDSIMTDTLNRRKVRLQWASKGLGWVMNRMPGLGPPPTEVAAQKLEEAWWNSVIDYTLHIMCFWFVAGIASYLQHGTFAVRVLRLALTSWPLFFYTPMLLIVFFQLPRLSLSLTSTLITVFNTKLVYPLVWAVLCGLEYHAWSEFFFPGQDDSDIAGWVFALHCCAVAYPLLAQLAQQLKGK